MTSSHTPRLEAQSWGSGQEGTAGTGARSCPRGPTDPPLSPRGGETHGGSGQRAAGGGEKASRRRRLFLRAPGVDNGRKPASDAREPQALAGAAGCLGSRHEEAGEAKPKGPSLSRKLEAAEAKAPERSVSARGGPAGAVPGGCCEPLDFATFPGCVGRRLLGSHEALTGFVQKPGASHRRLSPGDDVFRALQAPEHRGSENGIAAGSPPAA